MESPLKSLDKEYLIVGEGSGDESFIKNLCAVRNIQGFQTEDARGKDNFPVYLKGLAVRRGYEGVKGILIVGDSDDSPDENFNHIRNCFKDAKLPQPAAPLAVARHNRTSVAVCVMMIPYENGRAVRGCLDTLLLKYVEVARPEFMPHIAEFRKSVDGSNRPKNQEDKFKLRCFIAAAHPEDPGLTTTWAVNPSKGLIDLRHQTFDEIAAFVQGFPTLCQPTFG
jgi:hypothetical protein